MTEAPTIVPESPIATEPARTSAWDPASGWSAETLRDRTELAGYHYAAGLALLAFRNANPPNVRDRCEKLLKAIRRDTSARADKDEAIRRYFSLQAEGAAMAATRTEALERLAALESRQQRLMSPHNHRTPPPSTLDELQAALAKLAEEGRPTREALRVIDERARSLSVELRETHAAAADALRQHSRAVTLAHLERLRDERDKLLSAVAERCQGELARLHELHTALHGGAWQLNRTVSLDEEINAND